MKMFSLHFKAQRVTRFILVQFFALTGWIIVQLFFSLSPLGRALPFITLMFTEAIWWMALLLIMLQLFLREYNRFVRAALELEEANRRLRRGTNNLLQHLRTEHFPEESNEASHQASMADD
jgi:hypothetical protein